MKPLTFRQKVLSEKISQRYLHKIIAKDLKLDNGLGNVINKIQLQCCLYRCQFIQIQKF